MKRLLRASFRRGTTVANRTVANVSKMSAEEIAELERLLQLKRQGAPGIDLQIINLLVSQGCKCPSLCPCAWQVATRVMENSGASRSPRVA